jgi:monooxygenase
LKTYAILEARDSIGGTWDLFRYPGIRSDSDMYTLGYSFKPWEAAKSIADGPSILDYVRQTARSTASSSKIRFRHRVVRAEWSTADAAGRWRPSAPTPVRPSTAAAFLLHVQRLLPLRRGLHARLRGHRALRRAHRAPAEVDRRHRLRRQARRRDRQRRDRGDAASPRWRASAAHVTMLQRSPSYIVSLPGRPDRQGHAPRAAPEGLLPDHALEERAHHDARLPAQPAHDRG